MKDDSLSLNLGEEFSDDHSPVFVYVHMCIHMQLPELLVMFSFK